MSEPSKDIIIGNALDGLKTHHGYKVLIDEIIYPMYVDALLLLEAEENPKARATINAIKDIVAKIDDKISLGKQASEEYKQQLDKHAGTL